MPANWVPLIAQRQPAPDGSLRLVRAALLRADGSNEARIARGAILGGPPLKLYDEEVPREGARVVRSYQCTRWIGGQTVLWLGLRKSVGRGEGSSGLRFDGYRGVRAHVHRLASSDLWRSFGGDRNCLFRTVDCDIDTIDYPHRARRVVDAA